MYTSFIMDHIISLVTLFLSESHTSSHFTSSKLPFTSMHCLHFIYFPCCFSMYISIDARVLTTLSTMSLAPHFSLASLFLLFLFAGATGAPASQPIFFNLLLSLILCSTILLHLPSPVQISRMY